MRNGIRIQKRIAVCLIVLCMIISLAACGSKLSGTYASTGLISQTFSFDGNNVTMSAFGINVYAYRLNSAWHKMWRQPLKGAKRAVPGGTCGYSGNRTHRDRAGSRRSFRGKYRAGTP